MRYEVVLEDKHGRVLAMSSNELNEAHEVYETYKEVVPIGVRVVLLDNGQEIYPL